ncbi:MAG: hypothetical protein ABIM89_18740, partial [Mycobacteriales bacterium]
MTQFALQLFYLAVDQAPKMVPGLIVGAFFYYLERRGRGVVVLLLLFAVVLLDAILYAPAGTSAGIFHPPALGRDWPLPVLIVPLALLAHLLAGRRPVPLRWPAVLWGLFWLTIAAQAIVGIAAKHSTSLVFYEASIAVTIGGTAVLVAAVPVRDWVADNALPRLVLLTAFTVVGKFWSKAAHFAPFMEG